MNLRKFSLSKSILFSTTILLISTFLSFSVQAKDLVIYGASGNFGSDIVTEALNRGHNVLGVSRSPEKLSVDHPNFTAVKGDVSDIDSMLSIIKGCLLYTSPSPRDA